MSKILMVDDSKYICDAVKLMLDAKGFETDIASNGEKALEKLKKGKFDLIILDLMMPGAGGINLYKEIKNYRKTKDTKVIILTAKVDAKEKEPDLKDVDVFMPKPFDKEELVASVTKLIGK